MKAARSWVVLACMSCVIGACATNKPTVTYSGSVLDAIPKQTIRALRNSGQGSLTADQEADAGDEISRAFDASLIKCEVILRKYEYQANTARWTLLTISMLGAVAGGIVVPTLLARSTIPKGAVAAWSGLSGVTNLAQQTVVNEGLDPNSYVTTRAAIVTKMQQYISDYGKAQGDYKAQFAAISNIEGACVAYDIAKASQQVNIAPSIQDPPKPASELPDAPLALKTQVAKDSVTVTFDQPANASVVAIVEYVVSVEPKVGGNPLTGKGAKSPITVDGLSAKTEYKVSVVAKSASGAGPPTLGAFQTQ